MKMNKDIRSVAEFESDNFLVCVSCAYILSFSNSLTAPIKSSLRNINEHIKNKEKGYKTIQ